MLFGVTDVPYLLGLDLGNSIVSPAVQCLVLLSGLFLITCLLVVKYAGGFHG